MPSKALLVYAYGQAAPQGLPGDQDPQTTHALIGFTAHIDSPKRLELPALAHTPFLV